MPMTPSPTIATTLQDAARQGLARLDAQLLLLEALGQPADTGRAWLLAHDTDVLPPEALARWQNLLVRRLDGEPVAYLLGRHEFYGLLLHVDARVLDPRPDTETLVDWALELLPDLGPAPVVADLGTGSGAIACALAHHAPQATVWATDASADALTVARSNAQRLHLPIQFAQGSWLQALDGRIASALSLIVSNPPYIRADDPHLAALRHEPLSALASGADGLDDIRSLISQAPARLAPGGWLLLEHGYDQAPAVQHLLHEAGYSGVQSRTDLAGIARCTGGQIG